MDNNNQNQNKKSVQSKILKWTIVGLAVFTAAILIFGAGMIVGGAKARFSYRWAENYHRNFAGPKIGFMKNWQRPIAAPEEFIGSRGAFGEIVQINESGFVIKGKNNAEKLVIMGEKTVIQDGRKEISKNDLETGDFAVIIGQPNKNGQIEAKLIRIFNENPEESIIPPFFQRQI